MPSIKKTYFSALGLLMLLFSFASQTNAQSLTITNVSLPASTPLAFTITGGTLTSPVSIGASGAGQLLLNTQEQGVIGAWCVDLFHSINVGNVSYTYTTGFLATNSSGATQAASTALSASQIHDVLALAYYGNQELANTAFDTQGEKNYFSGKIQAAIWSVVYGAAILASVDVSPFTAANFNSEVAALVATASLKSTGTAVAIHNWATVGDATSLIKSQGLVTSFGQAVPAPGSLVLLAVGLIGLMARQRKNA